MIDGALALGLGLALLAAACFDSSYALQALEARRAPAADAMRPALLAHLARRPIWLGAIALAGVGWVLQVVALAHAPLTLVQPVLALGLFLLLGLGVVLLGERVGPREWAAVALIVVAVGLITYAAPTEPGSVPRDWGLVVALGVLGLGVVLPFAVAARGSAPVALLIAGAGAGDGLSAFVTKIVSEESQGGRWLLAAAWTALAALAVIAGLISESTALQRAPATRVGPIILVLQIAIPVIMAPLVGGEPWGGTPLGGAVLGFALALLAGGVLTLGSSPAVFEVLAEPEDAPASAGSGGQPG